MKATKDQRLLVKSLTLEVAGRLRPATWAGLARGFPEVHIRPPAPGGARRSWSPGLVAAAGTCVKWPVE